MIIMALKPGKFVDIVTTSIATFLFSLVVAFGFRMSNEAAIVATATYAAVLMVFVGASLDPSQNLCC